MNARMASDIKFVRKRLDELYRALEANDDYPFLWLDADLVPTPMVAGRRENGDVKWKLRRSTVRPTAITNLEARLRHQLPPMYRAYLQARFHLFEVLGFYRIKDKWNGKRTGSVDIAMLPCDAPFQLLESIVADYQPQKAQPSRLHWMFRRRLLKLGYIPMGWNIDEWFAFDTHFANSEGDYPVVVIPHSLENDYYGSKFGLLEISQYTYSLCPSFRDFVELFFTDKYLSRRNPYTG
jgi:hypothetical protein